MKALPDYSAYQGTEDVHTPDPHRNRPATVVIASIVLGVFFSLLLLGTIFLVSWIREGQTQGHGIMTFRKGALELLFAVWAGIEGAAGGLFASFFLLSVVEKKPLGRIMGRTILIHSIPILLIGLLVGIFPFGLSCGLWAFTGASFALTCAWIARLTPNMACGCHCTHCGYDMTGNLSGTCPECGAEFAPKVAEPKPAWP